MSARNEFEHVNTEEEVFWKLYRAIHALTNAHKSWDTLLNTDGKKIQKLIDRAYVIKGDAGIEQLEAKMESKYKIGITGLVNALEKIVEERFKDKTEDQINTLINRLNDKPDEEHFLRLICLLLNRADALLKPLMIPYSNPIIPVLISGVVTIPTKQKAAYHNVLNIVSPTFTLPGVNAQQLQQSPPAYLSPEKQEQQKHIEYLKTLNKAIISIGPTYDLLRENKWTATKSSDIDELERKVSKIMNTVEEEVRQVKESYKNKSDSKEATVEETVCYQRAAAHILLETQNYLDKRTRGNPKLIDDVNRDTDTHHALRLIALLFIKAYTGAHDDLKTVMGSYLVKSTLQNLQEQTVLNHENSSVREAYQQYYALLNKLTGVVKAAPAPQQFFSPEPQQSASAANTNVSSVKVNGTTQGKPSRASKL